MSTWTMILDDQKDRNFKLNKELSDDPDVSIMVIFEKSPEGNLTNYFIIKSNTTPSSFQDLKIPGGGGIKIPPNVG